MKCDEGVKVSLPAMTLQRKVSDSLVILFFYCFIRSISILQMFIFPLFCTFYVVVVSVLYSNCNFTRFSVLLSPFN